MVYREQLTFQTEGHGNIRDLTADVARIAARSGLRDGLIQVFNVGSTGAVGTMEFEPGLKKDLAELLDRLVRPSRDYGHEETWHDGNAHSHLQATLLGPALTLPLCAGKPVLGEWQQVVHVECDTRSRRRTVLVTVIGE